MTSIEQGCTSQIQRVYCAQQFLNFDVKICMNDISTFIGDHSLLMAVWIGLIGAVIYSFVKPILNKYTQIDAKALTLLINREQALVIDIRAKEDFSKGTISTALHYPTSQVEEGSVPQLKQQGDKQVVIVCQSGFTAPGSAQKLAKTGVENVAVLKGGIDGWVQGQLPLVKPKK